MAVRPDDRLTAPRSWPTLGLLRSETRAATVRADNHVNPALTAAGQSPGLRRPESSLPAPARRSRSHSTSALLTRSRTCPSTSHWANRVFIHMLVPPSWLVSRVPDARTSRNPGVPPLLRLCQPLPAKRRHIRAPTLRPGSPGTAQHQTQPAKNAHCPQCNERAIESERWSPGFWHGLRFRGGQDGHELRRGLFRQRRRLAGD